MIQQGTYLTPHAPTCIYSLHHPLHYREPGYILESPTPPAELALSQPCGSSALSFSGDTAVQLPSVCIEDSYV